MGIIAECEHCLAEYDAKRSTSRFCGPKCKQAFYRNRIAEPVTLSPKRVTLTQAKCVTVTEGKCWCCGGSIQAGLVCCGPCAWSGKAKAKRAGAYPPLLTDRTPEQMETDLRSTRLTGGYTMTASERANYKPASELKPGEYNHVSKLGDEDYDGVCTEKKAGAC